MNSPKEMDHKYAYQRIALQSINKSRCTMSNEKIFLNLQIKVLFLRKERKPDTLRCVHTGRASWNLNWLHKNSRVNWKWEIGTTKGIIFGENWNIRTFKRKRNWPLGFKFFEWHILSLRACKTIYSCILA